ncbi:hypothetical protein [Lutimonas zeaxanthinifaciens]|uniref:hypothetical protein n=1 Tax=Lutimonas zeaxanthinifaciens TaxID=3060215 RepID=UPI00265CAA7A|nr:hypothetical protein [Lutimonas sp. YSD2104]WKK67014.1 hypothetical protein QZH61_05175 [Lutimonas sp. YSD2104]
MYKSILLLAFTVLISCQINENEVKTESINKYSIFNGIYQSETGVEFFVSAKDSMLSITTDSRNLYKYSDSWADERIQKCNSKSIELIEATIQNDKIKIAEIFGDSPIDMDDYIEQYLSMHKEVLLANPKPTKYVIENTFYIDEISNHGHESNGWRWTTYCRVYWEDGRNQIVRYNWQPKTYFIDEWGLDKPVPFKSQMLFKPRFPFRSRINVYDPKTNTTKLLRNIDKPDREHAIPARFVAYNTEINQTVSVRFRILGSGEQYMEIGPIEDSLLVKSKKKTTPNNGYK